MGGLEQLFEGVEEGEAFGDRSEHVGKTRAKGRMRLLSTCGLVKNTVPMDKGTWPATASFIKGPPPLNGMWLKLMFPFLPNKAMDKWPKLPLPTVPKLTVFCALAAATTSAKLLYSEPTCVASSMAEVPTKMSGTRSFLLS